MQKLAYDPKFHCLTAKKVTQTFIQRGSLLNVPVVKTSIAVGNEKFGSLQDITFHTSMMQYGMISLKATDMDKNLVLSHSSSKCALMTIIKSR